MNPQEAIEQLKAIATMGDQEEMHIRADAVLLELINNREIADAYAAIGKWYS